jgi:hypothetical protein
MFCSKIEYLVSSQPSFAFLLVKSSKENGTVFSKNKNNLMGLRNRNYPMCHSQQSQMSSVRKYC